MWQTTSTRGVLSPSKLAGFTYVLGKVTSGNVVIGIGDTLVELAENVGKTSTQIEYAFLYQGCGMLLAALYIPCLYRTFNGDHVTFLGMALISLQWIWGARITDESVLYVWFFTTGLTAATVDTGTQILVRREFGEQAGPWLTALAFAFKGAGLYAPLLSYASSGLTEQYLWYSVLAALMAVVALLNLIDRRRRSHAEAAAAAAAASGNYIVAPLGNVSGRGNTGAANGERLGVAAAVANGSGISGGTAGALDSAVVKSNGLLNGLSQELGRELLEMQALPAAGCATVTSVVTSFGASPSGDDEGRRRSTGSENLLEDGSEGPRRSFIADFCRGVYLVDTLLAIMVFASIGAQSQCSSYLETFIIDTGATAKSQASLMLSMFWGVMLFSNILALFRQLDTTSRAIFLELYAFTLLAAAAAVPLALGGLFGDYQVWEIWAGVLGWGFFFGPTNGYIFDLHNRICDNQEEGPAMLMFGLNLGSSFMPVITLQLWNHGVGPLVLPMTLVVGMVATAICNSGLPLISPRLREALHRPKAKASGAAVVRSC